MEGSGKGFGKETGGWVRELNETFTYGFGWPDAFFQEEARIAGLCWSEEELKGIESVVNISNKGPIPGACPGHGSAPKRHRTDGLHAVQVAKPQAGPIFGCRVSRRCAFRGWGA